jgi:hypothetical protein
MTHGLLLSALLAPPVSANVVTDWDEIATRTLQTSYGTTVVASLVCAKMATQSRYQASMGGNHG